MKKRILIFFVILILVTTIVSAGTFNDVLSSLFGLTQNTPDITQLPSTDSVQSQLIQQAPQALTWVEYPPTGTFPIEPGFGIWTSKTIYDPVLRATILYASDSGATYSNSFWAYDSTTHTWQKKTTTGSTGSGACPTPATHPGDRHPYEQMDYDPIRGRMYLYGGVCSGTGLSDTWYYQSSGNSWTQASPSVNPGNMVEGALAFDSNSDLIVLYGGFNPSTANTLTQVWHYSPATNTWQNTAATLGDRYKNNMVYDNINRKVILFGGSQTYTGAALNDIWLYDTPTRTWTNPNPSTKPTGLKFPPIAFDTKRGYVFYYAGQGSLWTYSVAANTWTNLNVPGGPSISGDDANGLTLSYDAYTDKLIATSRSGCCSREAWELDLSSLPSPNYNGTCSTSTDIDNLPPGHWCEIPNSHLEVVLPPYDAGGTPGSIMAAWSGGAYDTQRNRLLVWGGGHNDYGGNEVYAFDLNSLSWSIIWGPSPNIPPRYSACAETYSDGNPSSRHTYEGLEYIPTTDELWSQGGSRWCSSGDNTRASWALNLASPSWNRKNDAADAKGGTTSAYDPVTGHVFRRGLANFEEYNPATGSFTVRQLSGSDNDGMTATIDPERRYYVEIGRPSWSTSGDIHIWNIQNYTRIPQASIPSSATNCPCIDGAAPGFDYDPITKRLIAWSGGTSVYSLNVSSWTWTRIDAAPTNIVTPTSPTPNGVFGRFRYIPSKNLYVVVNDISQNVFVYKLSSGGGLPPQQVCGNGIIESTEACDDGNTNNADGCSSTCALESGWKCAGQPSRCMFGVPYPPSTVITNITWDYANLARAAPGSDLWPVTWSDDGHLYTSWGDGGGFGGDDTLGRVSFGVGKIQGTGGNWQGTNIWGGVNPLSSQTPTTGKSNGGIISIGGVLYTFVQEQNIWTRSKLWQSINHGLSWTDMGWVLEWPNGAFSDPGLIQFGQDYQGARDNYVYGYSEAGMGSSPPGIGLFRVPRGSLANRTAYEFFSGLDINSNPTWSTDVNQRQPVFSDPNGVNWGVNAMYNPVLGRYIMAVAHTSTGDWGIFEAPQPWGPWNTVGYYNDWIDSQFKFTFIFPQKWMSSDSKTMYMIFSGTGVYDSFNVIKATLTTSSQQDTTPPNRINLNPLGTSFATNTTQVTISLNTDEIATCRFSTSPNIPYSSMIVSFPQANSTIHSTIISGLVPGDSKTYYVKCIDQLGNANTNDAQIYFSIALPDTTPPTITQVTSSGDPTKVTVVFSEPVEQTSATTISNYAINNGIIISGASLAADTKTVTLTTSSHTQGPTYILTVSNIRDRAPVPNTITPNTQASYIFTPQLVISNLVVSSARAYQVVDNGLVVGALTYIDRTFTFSSIPSSLIGKTYIQTANDDKASTANPFLSFDVNQDVTIYIAHDNRITTKPTWLSSFTDTLNDISSTDTTFSLFERNFTPGTITLGGNEGGGFSMYSIIIAGKGSTSPPTPTNDTTPPTISGVQSTSITSSSAIITWTTNEASDTQVEYGLTTSYGQSTILNSVQVTSHSQQITGLSPITLYHYRVKSRDAVGNLATSGDFTLTTTNITIPPPINATCGTPLTDPTITLTPGPTPPRPSLSVQYIDPNLGGCITRVTDNVQLGSRNTVPIYSQLQAWNADQSKILITSSKILYANNYSLYKATPSLSAPKWSQTDPNIIYSTSGNSYIKYNIDTGIVTTLRTFAEYANLYKDTSFEEHPENDRYVLLEGCFTSGCGSSTELFIYDIVNDVKSKVITGQPAGGCGGADWAAMSPLGDYAMINWGGGGDALYCGLAAYNLSMDYVGKVATGHGHGDLAIDKNGEQWYVYYTHDNYVGISGPRIVKAKIPSGYDQWLQDNTKGLYSLLNTGWTVSGHLSCQSPRSGWCVASSYGFDIVNPWVPFADEIYRVYLDSIESNPNIERFVHHRSDPDYISNDLSCPLSGYWAQPHATSSRDGSKIIYGSSWGQNCFVESYIIDLGSGVTQQLPVLTILSPTSGQNIAGSQVNVVYTKSGNLSQVDHVHLQLDSNPEIRDLDFDGFYNFTSVPVGSHTIIGYLAYANHTEVSGTRKQVSFSTTSADTIPPSITSIAATPTSPVVYTSPQTHTFTSTITDNVALQTVYLENNFNGQTTNTTVTSATSTYSFSRGALHAGIYTYKFIAIDTQGNQATSAQQTYQVNQAAPTTTLFLSPSSPITYGTQTAASCTDTNQEATPILYRNSQVISQGTYTLGAGTYNFTCITPSTQNYTASSSTNPAYQVNKAPSQVSLTLNGVAGDTTSSTGEIVSITGTLTTPSQGQITIYENGAVIANTNSPVALNRNYTTQGIYNITAYYVGNQNYSQFQITRFIQVIQVVSQIDTIAPTLLRTSTYPPSPATYSKSQSYQFNATWIDNKQVQTVLIEHNFIGNSGNFRNNTVATNLSSEYYFTRSRLAAKTYTYKWIAIDTSSNQNTSQTLTYTVNKAQAIASLLISPTPSTTYGTPTQTDCTTTNDETSPIIYLDSQAISSGSYTLGADSYNISCFSPMTENYTEASTELLYQVMQSPSQVQLTLNGQRGPISVSQGQQVQITGTLTTPTQGIVTIYQNSVPLSQGTSPLSIIQTYNTIGTYNITAYYAGNQNYTSSYETHFVQVGPGPDTAPPSVIINSPQDNSVITSSQVSFNCTASDNVRLSNISLVLDSQIYSTISLNTQTTTQTFTRTLGDGIHTFACEAYDNSSNKAIAQTRTITVQTVCTTNCEINISLVQGVNLISLPLVQQNYSIENIIQSIKPYIDTIYTYDSITLWKVYHRDTTIPSTLGTLEPRKGFFVIANSPSTLRVRGNLYDPNNNIPPLVLSPGWNLIGVHNLTDAKPDDVITVPYLSIWDFQTGLQSYRKVNTTQERLLPSKGYWVYI